MKIVKRTDSAMARTKIHGVLYTNLLLTLQSFYFQKLNDVYTHCSVAKHNIY